MDKKELWLKLKNYHFDHIVSPGLWDHISAKFGKTDPSFRAFAGKIARKHGWKTNFSLRALNEYKKFIYLGLVSDFLVTPSKIIDVVWHEHLLFSKAYRDFSNEVIEQPFDHYPELIPAEEQTCRFSAQYWTPLIYTRLSLVLNLRLIYGVIQNLTKNRLGVTVTSQRRKNMLIIVSTVAAVC